MEKRNRKSEISLKVNLCAMILIAMLASPCIGAEDPAKFPSKPITLIVPWAAGGNTDLTARKLADLASKILGQPIVVENKAGGGGVIGNTAIARAVPDGYTIGTATYGSVFTPHLRPVPYDLKEDFTWIMQCTEPPMVFCVKADSHWKTFKEFVEETRKNPGKLSYTTPGPRAGQHIFMEQVFLVEKVNLNHVPVGGGSEVVMQLLGGHVDAGITSEVISHILTGKLRGLAIQGEKRIGVLPDIPTFLELGYKIDVILWIGLFGPKGLDPRVHKKLFDAFKKAYEDPSFKEFCTTINVTPILKDSESFKTMVYKQFDEQGKILRELGFAK